MMTHLILVWTGSVEEDGAEDVVGVCQPLPKKSWTLSWINTWLLLDTNSTVNLTST